MTYAKTAFAQRGVFAIVLTGTMLFVASCSEKSATLGPQASVLAVPDTVIITPESDTINAIGDSIFLSAVVYDASNNVLADPVVWKSNNLARATVANGWVTATGRGAVTVSGRAGTARTLVRIVVQQVVDSIAVTPQAPTVQVGDTTRLYLYAADSAGTPVSGGTIQWASSNPSVATVDGTGLVTAVAGGTVNVTARLSGSGIISPVRGKTRVTTVYPPNALVISPPLDTLRAVGYQKQYTTNTMTVNGNPIPVTFRSLNPNFATIDSITGLATAVKRGLAKIVAKAGTFADTADLHVVPIVATVATTPPTVNLAIGDTTTLVGVPYDSGGTPIPAKLNWSSNAPGIATVDSEGLVTAIAAGTAYIVGSRGGVRDSTEVIVASPDSTVHVWTTGIAGDWTDASKWTPGVVPAVTDSAQVPLTGSAIALTAATTIAHLTVGTGANIALGANDLTVVNDVLVDAGGSITSSTGRLLLTGIGGIGGSIPGTVITGARSATQNVFVSQALTIQDGSLVIADKTLTIAIP